MQNNLIMQYVDAFWEQNILPSLKEYIRIPNKSPHFDPNWVQHGYMDAAVHLIADWCKQHAIHDMHIEIMQLPERTPIILIDIPGTLKDTILLYGHLDKQPEMSGWDEDLNPWMPVQKAEKLYGRGAADDGYAVFAALAAIKALQSQHIEHHRCVILIEACEESGSYDLPFYIDALEKRISPPKLIICLDSGCGNYDQLWLTTSLRGLVSGVLTIEVLSQGIHSGSGSGVVPSTSRILRQLIARLENIDNGDILLKELMVEIPQHRLQQVEKAAHILGPQFLTDFPFLPQVTAEATAITELMLRRTWKPTLSLIGADHLPMLENAGNVVLPKLAVKLSFRLPPTCDADKASRAIKKILEENPPYGAHIQFTVSDLGSGWNAPQETSWLVEACNQASLNFFGKEAVYMGEGGSIPFMGMLGKKFPKAQFVITGVLGPHSNAHGPNEFLHIPMAKKLTACISYIIAAAGKE